MKNLPPNSERPTDRLPDFDPKKAWRDAAERVKLANAEKGRIAEARRLQELLESLDD